MKKFTFFFILFFTLIIPVLWYEVKDLTSLWYSKETASYIITKCNSIQWIKLKKSKWDAKHCIRLAASIWCAESSCWKKTSLNPWWFRNKKFKSQLMAFDAWFKSYKKYWYKRKWWAKDFYSLNWIPSPTRYCTDEASSWLRKFHCWNWYKHFTTVRNKLWKKSGKK